MGAAVAECAGKWVRCEGCVWDKSVKNPDLGGGPAYKWRGRMCSARSLS